MSVEKIVLNPAGQKTFRQGLGHGLANLMLAWESGGKRNAPVRGGHRSFNPGGPIGGTLRRSIHAAVYVDGVRIVGGTDENGNGTPDYATDGITGVIGTNTNYGEYVHDGTYKMPARPFLAEALADLRADAQALVLAGALRFFHGAG